MDDVPIYLPCGSETTFGCLQNDENVIRCMMCEDEDLDVEDIINRPGNRLRLNEKEIELKIQNLKKLSENLLTIKQDPRFYVEQSFERIFNQLELRREELKKEFEKQLDNYYLELRDNIVNKKQKIIGDLDKYFEDFNTFNFDKDNSIAENSKSLKEKVKSTEFELEKIAKKSKEIEQIISDTMYGEQLELVLTENQINMNKLFGTIHNKSKLSNYKESAVLDGHSNAVFSIQQVDKNTILSGSADTTIRLWELKEKKCLIEFKGHSDIVYDLCMLKNDHFASASFDQTIKIWNIKDGKCVKTLIGHNDYVSGLKFLLNDQLISSSNDKTIKIWNIDTGECIRKLTGHNDKVYCIEVWTNDLIISGSVDRTIKIWNIETGENLKTLEHHNDSVLCLKLINSNELASGSCDKMIKIWDLSTGKCLKTLKGHSGLVRKLAMLISGHLVSCSEDGTIKFWHIDSGECLKTIKAHNNIYCLLVTKNEDIISGSSDKTLKVWTKAN